MSTLRYALAGAGGALAIAVAFTLGMFYVQRSPTIDAVHDLNLQKSCSEAALKYFQLQNPENDADTTSSFTNHYNTRLHRCFVLITMHDEAHESTDHYHEYLLQLDDAFDRSSFGFCDKRYLLEPQSLELPLCFKKINGQRTVEIKREADWDSYVADLMNS